VSALKAPDGLRFEVPARIWHQAAEAISASNRWSAEFPCLAWLARWRNSREGEEGPGLGVEMQRLAACQACRRIAIQFWRPLMHDRDASDRRPTPEWRHFPGIERNSEPRKVEFGSNAHAYSCRSQTAAFRRPGVTSPPLQWIKPRPGSDTRYRIGAANVASRLRLACR
jgi:hypothetical protein